jgi:hypothetical protein
LIPCRRAELIAPQATVARQRGHGWIQDVALFQLDRLEGIQAMACNAKL